MDMKKVSIYCFSGTGNTLIVAKTAKKVLEEKGLNTKLFLIEREDPKNVELDGMIGICFPIAVFTSYPLVMDFISKLPQAEGTPVFMMSTMGGMSAGIRTYVRSLLIRKGYRPLGAKQIVMPDNYMASAEKDKKNPDIVNKGVNEVAPFINDVLSNRSKWGSFPILPGLFYPLFQYLFTMSSFRKAVKINKDKCVKCGTCSKICPVNNIIMREYPAFLDKCEVCMRCISYCPKGALYRRHDGEHVYRGVDLSEFLPPAKKARE